MAKSKSQRMKGYRARKKEQRGKRWLKMERERIKVYFQPLEMLSDYQKEKRRNKSSRAAHAFYRTHKTDTNYNADLGDMNENPNTIEHVASGSNASDDNGVSTTTSELSLRVQIPFHYPGGSQGKGDRKRLSNALKRQNNINTEI